MRGKVVIPVLFLASLRLGWADIVYYFAAPWGNWNYASANWNPNGNPFRTDTVGDGDTVNIAAGQTVIFNHLVSSWDADHAGASVLNNAGVLVVGEPTYTDRIVLRVDTTLNNTGVIQIGHTGNTGQVWLDVGNTVINGPGVINLNGPANLLTGGGTVSIFGQTIQGVGTVGYYPDMGWGAFSSINLDPASVITSNTNGGTLNIIRDGTLSGGALRAENGGSLYLFGTNINGSRVEALDGSRITLDADHGSNVMTGGVITTSGSGAVYPNGGYTLKDLTTSGNVIAADGQRLPLSGVINNTGTLVVGQTTGAVLNGLPAALTGGGTVLVNEGSSLWGTLTNHDNSMVFTGNAGVNGELINYGGMTVTAGHSLDFTSASRFENQGYLRVESGAQLVGYWQNAAPNYSNGVLSGGTFDLAGLAQLVPQGAYVTTNAANVILDGPNSLISGMNDFENFANYDALGQLKTNTGSFTIKNGRDFTTTGIFLNQGTLTVGAGSTFAVGSSPLEIYTQTAGSTLVNGTLEAEKLDIEGGSVGGSGKIHAGVLLRGSLNPGSSPGTLTIEGDVEEDSTGEIHMQFLSLDASGYDRFIVYGDLAMDGLLALELDGYVPHASDLFAGVLSWTGSLTLGDNFHISGLDLGEGFFFVPIWDANSLDIGVTGGGSSSIPEPAPALLVGSALAAVALMTRRRRAQ